VTNKGNIQRTCGVGQSWTCRGSRFASTTNWTYIRTGAADCRRLG